MTNFIRLTIRSASNRSPIIYINYDKIETIQGHEGPTGRKEAIITFSGTEDNTLHVEETPEQILEEIKELDNDI